MLGHWTQHIQRAPVDVHQMRKKSSPPLVGAHGSVTEMWWLPEGAGRSAVSINELRASLKGPFLVHSEF